MTQVLKESLSKAAAWAHIDAEPLVALSAEVQAAINSGNPRELDQLLRTVCPADMWPWPAYTEYALRVNEKPSRIRMVAALCHRIMRDAHWAEHMPELLAGSDRRPLWQFRDCGDGRDPEACEDLSGTTERFDSAFWQANNPAHCDQVMCRCSIRAYRLDEEH